MYAWKDPVAAIRVILRSAKSVGRDCQPQQAMPRVSMNSL